MSIALQSVILSLPISKQTAMMMTTDATFTASKNAENRFEFRIFFTKGFNNVTKTKEGKKMAMVEITAPEKLNFG